MTSKHTPGPWTVVETPEHVRVIGGNCENIFMDQKNIPCVIEDAHLISAAPDLLVTVVELISWIPGAAHFHTDAPQKAVERARAAIAKATGEQP